MQSYAETLKFEVNGVTAIHVHLAGQGTKLQLVLANVAQAQTHFGQLRVGQEVTKSVKVVNRSAVPVTFNLEPCAALLKARGVNLLNFGDLYLRSMESVHLQFQFRPAARQRPFTEDVVVQVAGTRKTLLTLSGACLGIEAKLATDHVSFGPVVKGSRLVKHLMLSNTGDVGTKFTWATEDMAPSFHVTPEDGFLANNQDVRLEVVFHPAELDNDIRADRVRCRVEGGEDQFLNLSGMCVEAEQHDGAVTFVATVRETAVQKVSITNPTEATWSLRPVIQNEIW